MEYITATRECVDEIYELVQSTITGIYPKYYPREVVDFFCEYHNKENILKDIDLGVVGMLYDEGIFVGTGSYNDNHITRIYVNPMYHGKGYGSYIIHILENKIATNHEYSLLEASLPASGLYEKLGYVTVKHERYECENATMLVYEVMKKKL